MAKAGFCGSIFICLLVLINTFFFLIGLAFFVASAIFKWTGLFGDIKKEILQIVPELKFVDSLFTVFLIVGGVIMLVSLAGFIGACCRSRSFLIMYEIVIALVFIGHLAALIYIMTKASEVDQKIKDDINTFVNNLINQWYPSPVKASQEEPKINLAKATCETYKKAADFLKCCDFNTTYVIVRRNCCPVESEIRETCLQKVTSMTYFLVIILPNSIILSFEFIVILAVLYLITKFSKSTKRINDDYQMRNKY